MFKSIKNKHIRTLIINTLSRNNKIIKNKDCFIKEKAELITNSLENLCNELQSHNIDEDNLFKIQNCVEKSQLMVKKIAEFL